MPRPCPTRCLVVTHLLLNDEWDAMLSLHDDLPPAARRAEVLKSLVVADEELDPAAGGYGDSPVRVLDGRWARIGRG